MFRKKGFTLIELLIVVIIIGVLAALAIPRYTGFVEKARAAEALAMISALKSAEAVYKQESGSYTNDITQIGIENAYATAQSAIDAGQMWYYGIALDQSVGGSVYHYRIRASRDAKNPGGQSDKTIDFYWSDTYGSKWGTISGTYGHPGTPK